MTRSIQNILADWIEIQIQSSSQIPVLFVSGAQGIGKSTAFEYVAQKFDQRLAILGLDDFYLTKAERDALSEKVHPLFTVRGPPGTHDITFLRDTIHALKCAGADSEIEIPRFDKRCDDRFATNEWTTFRGCPSAILVEGWCIGAEPALGDQDAPLNAVEASDPSGRWLDYQEEQLAGPYAALWDQADAFFHLRAPSFDQVFDWRLQQEATTHGVAQEDLPDGTRDWLRNFIQHYERLTRRMLSGGRRRGYTLNVDSDRCPDTVHPTPLIVFSDLDGTLLDHTNYSFDAAAPALAQLQETKSVLVLASSKAAAEIYEIRAQMGFEHCPAIVENGAGLLEPGQSSSTMDDESYQKIRSILAQVPQDLRQHFEGFGDCSVDRVSALTGLSLLDAERAKTRHFSEPGRWSGTEGGLDEFLEHLETHEIYARRGGRFLTLSFGSTKADKMFEIASRYTPAPLMALGDAPNDVEMLEAANHAVIIKNSSGAQIPTLQRESTDHVVRTEAEGPTGWNIAVIKQMQRLGLGQLEE